MMKALRYFVAAACIALISCGGHAVSSDGGSAGSGGGRGGMTGGAGSAGSGVAGTDAAGGTTGGDTTGAAGAGGAGIAGGAGVGAAGDGASAGRGGATATAGTGGTVPPRCEAPTDCAGALTGSTFCPSPSWSCIGSVTGRCVAECMGGRTCREGPDSGCLYCASSSPPSQVSEGCVRTACAFDPARIRDVQQSSGCEASNTPHFDTWHCTGNWAVLPGGDRPICTIQMLPTDAVRYSVSCGSCITIVTL